MTEVSRPAQSAPISPEKFQDPIHTANGELRATVTLQRLQTLWMNTGTLCNLTCEHCYIESSPTNDRLVYLTAAEVAAYLDEVEAGDWGTEEIGFTGGEPFMNPELISMLEDVLRRGFRALVLTNAMRPMMKCREALLDLRARYGEQLVLRVSLDHFGRAVHEQERGPRSWEPAIAGLRWLAENDFALNVAGRTAWGETVPKLREGFARLFENRNIPVDAANPEALVLFPEMDERVDVPEITGACWGILDVSPNAMMCSSSRMIVKRKGAQRPAVVACTLLPYDSQFELGETLESAARTVPLNHPHCAKFCVLGGGSCSVSG